RAEGVGLARPAAVGVLDGDLEHVGVALPMHLMTARARRASALDAAALQQRLRTIEPVRASIGPEITLRIVFGNRLADQERQREVLVAIARAEPEEHVVLVAVAVAARVE